MPRRASQTRTRTSRSNSNHSPWVVHFLFAGYQQSKERLTGLVKVQLAVWISEEVVDPPYSLKLVEECSLDLVLSSLFCYPGAATNNCLVSAVNLSWLSILNSALHELHLMYDWDAATTANFLRKYGLAGEFKLNIERNHATLSGRRVLVFCLVALYLFVSRDFSLRRESTDVEHLFIAHISGMDTLVRGLRNVAMLIEMIHSSFLRSIRGTRGDDFPISSIDD
ncbi:hypothetical protein RHGRI_000080 [Rhododendron griersonianum]|uniref:xylose isomerase n=1 Tax=Rhododendron griersonianum TaxID=479676 RepID=A0AAV6LHC3_9ERIC|nr:hypothetical protein RHGRI_000080 [Rhododendron griersonianum]